MTIRNNWPQNWWPAIDENGKVLTRKSNFYDLASEDILNLVEIGE